MSFFLGIWILRCVPESLVLGCYLQDKNRLTVMGKSGEHTLHISQITVVLCLIVASSFGTWHILPFSLNPYNGPVWSIL